MKTIPLTQGKFALVDDADYAAVSAFKWRANTIGRKTYARRTVRTADGSRTALGLHQFLLPNAKRIDHRDGDGLNNQRGNLRPATRRQNARAFQSKHRDATSKFRGVTLHRKGKWQAGIEVAGRFVYLGLFIVEEAAARAYDTAARKYFREFAAPNFPRSVQQ